MTEWSLVYEDFVPEQEGLREALCTLGNGVFAARGAAPEATADDFHYPGTYAAGVYDRLRTEIAGRTVANEDLVNLPNWLVLTFRPLDGEWLDLRRVRVSDYRQELDLRTGVLTRAFRFADGAGRVTAVTQRRLVSMAEPQLAALETTVVPENWSGPLQVRSALDGTVTNSGVARYRSLRGDHLVPVSAEPIGDDGIGLVVETRDSHVRIGTAARTRPLRGNGPVVAGRRLLREGGFIAHEIDLDVEEGVPITVEKVVALVTSRAHAIYEPGEDAAERIGRADAFDDLLERHVLAWNHLWQRFDIRIEGPERAQAILRLHIFHLLQTVSTNTIDLDVGVPARGLHGEAYRGHIFWDELFIFPLLNMRLPALTRTLLNYRYRRLAEAKWAAKQAGFEGAMYPWQSGSDGQEESQTLHLNPRSGRWLPDNSHLQRHINIAVAYNVWQYFQVTDDMEFLRFRGAPMLIEIARFWASIASYDRATDRYGIRGVMGPDEYHDGYPDREAPGLDNNAYTNVMVVWLICRVLELLERLPDHHRQALWETLRLTREELDRWEDISRKMAIPFHDGIISQFEGYEGLQEFDWAAYRERYGDIQRLDRILEAEGDTPNRYKVSKQADVLMLFYLLSADELREILERLGYELPPEAIPRIVDYYLERTSHGSTLSRVVHSWVVARSDRSRSWELFSEALESDVADVQGGTTPEGIHLGAMAGTVDLVQRGYTGLEVRGDVLWFNPAIPEEFQALECEVHYRGHRVQVRITPDRLQLSTIPSEVAPIQVGFLDEVVELLPGTNVEWSLVE
ncbi:MAG TPA: glycosyl hydrolase family 65 protein [Actinomycetota bacterium]